MTEPHSIRAYTYNNEAWGEPLFFTSVRTGKKLLFRPNEIASVKPDRNGGAVVTSVGGLDFEVTSMQPETIR